MSIRPQTAELRRRLRELLISYNDRVNGAASDAELIERVVALDEFDRKEVTLDLVGMIDLLIGERADATGRQPDEELARFLADLTITDIALGETNDDADS